ncbi:MAG: GNAT family N-acetyltransferase, partial [Anaerolineales bacterium]|nr:GNAT family N-acetyltransferase [Anaerolineales bacterium]
MIYSGRIRLRAPERSDIPRFVAWLNDPEVRAGLLVSLPLSTADEEGWFEAMLKRPLEEHPLTIEVRQGDDWLPVGNCGFHNIDWRCRAAEVGIFIGEKSLWNQGYGTEVMRLLLKHGFHTLNLNRIALDVYETNPRAIHSYEKAGFVHEGRRRQAMFKDGRYVDILQMSV